MKATYENFIADNPTCSKYKNCNDARRVFDILSEDANLISMVDATESGKPALLGCLGVLEKSFDDKQFTSFDLTDGFARTVVGRMVRSVLAPLGYLVLEPQSRSQKDFPKSARAKYFKSASCYEKTGTATMKVVKTIVPVQSSVL